MYEYLDSSFYVAYHFVTGMNCTNGDIKLADGAGNHYGRIEVCFGGYWGAVCRWHFDWVTHTNELVFSETDARVACRQLGFPLAGRYILILITLSPLTCYLLNTCILLFTMQSPFLRWVILVLAQAQSFLATYNVMG